MANYSKLYFTLQTKSSLTQEIEKTTPQTHCGSKQNEQRHRKKEEYIRTKSRVLSLHERSIQRAELTLSPLNHPRMKESAH